MFVVKVGPNQYLTKMGFRKTCKPLYTLVFLDVKYDV